MKILENLSIITTNEFNSKGFSKLSENGANVYHFPMIKTESLERKVNTKDYSCLIFTSKNGVRYFFQNNNIDSNIKAITIGYKTAEELKKYGIKADYICSRNYSNEMAIELKKNNVLKNEKSLLLQGELANNKLLKSLSKFTHVERLNIYKTIFIKKIETKLKELLEVNPFIIFTSASCFESFNNLYDSSKAKLISIGKTTTLYIESKGFKTTTTAKMQTYEGISQSIIDFFKKETYNELS